MPIGIADRAHLQAVKGKLLFFKAKQRAKLAGGCDPYTVETYRAEHRKVTLSSNTLLKYRTMTRGKKL